MEQENLKEIKVYAMEIRGQYEKSMIAFKFDPLFDLNSEHHQYQEREVEVELFKLGDEGKESTSLKKKLKTAGGGQYFQFSKFFMRPGKYELRIKTEGYKPLSIPFEIKPQRIVVELLRYPPEMKVGETAEIVFQTKVRDPQQNEKPVDLRRIKVVYLPSKVEVLATTKHGLLHIPFSAAREGEYRIRVYAEREDGFSDVYDAEARVLVKAAGLPIAVKEAIEAKKQASEPVTGEINIEQIEENVVENANSATPLANPIPEIRRISREEMEQMPLEDLEKLVEELRQKAKELKDLYEKNPNPDLKAKAIEAYDFSFLAGQILENRKENVQIKQESSPVTTNKASKPETDQAVAEEKVIEMIEKEVFMVENPYPDPIESKPETANAEAQSESEAENPPQEEASAESTPQLDEQQEKVEEKVESEAPEAKSESEQAIEAKPQEQKEEENIEVQEETGAKVEEKKVEEENREMVEGDETKEEIKPETEDKNVVEPVVEAEKKEEKDVEPAVNVEKKDERKEEKSVEVAPNILRQRIRPKGTPTVRELVGVGILAILLLVLAMILAIRVLPNISFNEIKVAEPNQPQQEPVVSEQIPAPTERQAEAENASEVSAAPSSESVQDPVQSPTESAQESAQTESEEPDQTEPESSIGIQVVVEHVDGKEIIVVKNPPEDLSKIRIWKEICPPACDRELYIKFIGPKKEIFYVPVDPSSLL